MRVRTQQRRTGRHEPFSRLNQPAKRGRPALGVPAPDGKWNERAVLRLAEKGVEGADIVKTMRLTHLLTGDASIRAKFEEVLELGHARHRLMVAKRMRSEADKGRSNALKALAEAWLTRYSDETLTEQDEAGIIERGLELIRQIKRRRVENEKYAAEQAAAAEAKP